MNSPRLQHISERQPITSVDRRQPTKRTPSGRRHASNGHIDEDSTNMGSQEPEGSSLRARATLFDKLLLAIKQWFQKHQVLIHSVQYVSSMAIVFIPSSFPFRDLLGEACYALSNMISHLNEVVLHVPPKRFRDLDFLVHEFVRLITLLEIVIEKTAARLGSLLWKHSVILCIESMKAFGRLLIYRSHRDHIMLINWSKGPLLNEAAPSSSSDGVGRNTNGATNSGSTKRFTLAHYILWYRVGMISVKDHSLASQNSPTADSSRSTTPSPAPTPSPFLTRQLRKLERHLHSSSGGGDSAEGRHQGKRSGLTFRSTAISTFMGLQQTPTPSRGLSVGSIGSTGSGSTTSSNASSQNSSPAMAPSEYAIQQSTAPASDDPFLFSSEQLLAAGEILYIIRPVIYSWMLRQAHVHLRPRHTEDQTNSESTGPDPDASEEDPEGAEESKQLALAQAVALFTSLVIELISIQLTTKALSQQRKKLYTEIVAALDNNNNSPTRSATSAKKRLQEVVDKSFPQNKSHAFDQELSRRKFALFFYLIRSPLFDRATLPALQLVAQYLQYIPLINALPGYVVDALKYFNQSYFRNSSSS